MSTPKIVAIVAGALLVVVGAGGALVGFAPISRDVHPPCEELPSVEEAAAALDSDPAFAEDIEALGDDITVQVGRPCPDEYPDRGLITVTYGSRSERDAIQEMLGRRDGIGVPLYLERR